MSEETKKKKLPWWVYLLQLLPATIDSIRLLVKEAKQKKKLKKNNVIADETKQSAEKTAIDSTTTATDEKPMD